MQVLNDDWYLRQYPGIIFDQKYGVFGIFSSSDQAESIAFGDTSHAQLEGDFTAKNCSMIGGGAMTYEQNQIRLTGNTFNTTHPPLSGKIITKVERIIGSILRVDTILVVPRDELVRKKC